MSMKSKAAVFGVLLGNLASPRPELFMDVQAYTPHYIYHRPNHQGQRWLNTRLSSSRSVLRSGNGGRTNNGGDDDPWETRYQELLAYQKLHNTTQVPRSSGPLGLWVTDQRLRRRATTGGTVVRLTEERRRRLDSIGFLWDPRDEAWMAKYQELYAYKVQHGHCHVSLSSFNESNHTQIVMSGSLWAWVERQRLYYGIKKRKKDTPHPKLTPERVELLNEIDFVWNVSDWLFRQSIEKLQKYVDDGGNLAGLKSNDGSLGHWFGDKKLQYRRYLEGKNHTLDADRVGLLEGIGLTKEVAYFTPASPRRARGNVGWNIRIQQLARFKAIHGDCLVPSGYREFDRLGSWVQSIRKKAKKKELSPDEVRELEDVGFVWSVEEWRWQKRYEELVNFVRENGHTNVPLVEHEKLGRWVTRQRAVYRGTKKTTRPLTTKQIEALEELGFEWERGVNVKETDGETFRGRVKEYEELRSVARSSANTYHGVPESLGTWLANQRRTYRKHLAGKESSLSNFPERVTELERIGLVDDLKAGINWRETRFRERVMEYEAMYHNTTKAKGSPSDSLRVWVAAQRSGYRRWRRGESKVLSNTPARISELERIGLVADIQFHG